MILNTCTYKEPTTNIYAIVNAKTGKAVRPHNAKKHDETNLTLFPRWRWGCLTWELTDLGNNTYSLKNLHSQKTFEPSSNPQSGVILWQQPLNENGRQHWEFIEQPDETFLIRLKDTELYVTTTSTKNNSVIVLMPKQDTDSQLWRLVRQKPIF